MPKYHKIQRGICLALFAASSILSCIQYHTNAVVIAGLSLVGVIAYDVVCYFKDVTKVKDFSEDIARVEASQIDLIAKVSDIRNDATIGKLAETFRRK